MGCMCSLYNGTLEWGQTHVVESCVAVSETCERQGTSDKADLDGNMYAFEQMNCSKTAGPGVSAVVRQSTKDRNTIASELVVGDFVLFDAHGDEVEPIWLGRVLPNPEWNGQGVCTNNSGKQVKFNGVSIGRGEVAIYVMWYEKLNVMSDKLEYGVSRSEREPLVQNNRTLVPVEVNLHQMLGTKNSVPKLRTSTRVENDRSMENSQKRIRDWHDKELDIIWKMDLELRRLALSLCGL